MWNHLSDAIVRRCSVKKVFVKISQNSQQNTCATVSFLIKLLVSTCNFIKKRLLHRCFPVSFVKFLKTPFFKDHLWWLFLTVEIVSRSRSRSRLVLWNWKKKKATEDIFKKFTKFHLVYKIMLFVTHLHVLFIYIWI